MSEHVESSHGQAPLDPHQFISLMVIDLAGEMRMSVEAHVLSASLGVDEHELQLYWDDAPEPIVVSCPPGDRWTVAEEVLLEVASRATNLGLTFIKPGCWDRIMLRVPGPASGPVREFILEMRRVDDASLWLRGDVLAHRRRLPAQDYRWELDCINALTMVFGDMLEPCAKLLGRGAASVARPA